MNPQNRWGEPRRPPDPRATEPLPRVAFEAPPAPTVQVPVQVPPAAADDETETEHIVRPFIVTGGRTRPTDERLRVETIVTAVPAALSAPLGFERRHIVEICQRPISVAEISHSLGVPIGVARVVIADLITEQYLTVHDHLGPGGYPSQALLERIREGVRAL